MTGDTAIRIEGLGKRYRIGVGQKTGMYRYKSLRDTLGNAVRRPLSLLGRRGPMTEANSFWALDDVGFEVKRGEVVGIIGRNGAGKSTLLKILSRITKPTVGHVELRGRVGSLLEVGTGFHPELSGRENVYLNGAVLGMTRREVKSKFDEIVAFSEVERFLDTPVKQYSSGMYTRLAFAVAAHLEPEILVVDEVLAVGDAAFQKKCVGKMKDVAETGRTVLFVSHNMPTIMRLCETAVLLEDGRVREAGELSHVVQKYLDVGSGKFATVEWKDGKGPGDGTARLLAVRVLGADGESSYEHDVLNEVRVEVDYVLGETAARVTPNFHVFNSGGDRVFMTMHTRIALQKIPPNPGRYRATAVIPANLLTEGIYTISMSLTNFTPFAVHAHVDDVVSFAVNDLLTGDSARGPFAGYFPGILRPKLHWETEAMDREGTPVPISQRPLS